MLGLRCVYKRLDLLSRPVDQDFYTTAGLSVLIGSSTSRGCGCFVSDHKGLLANRSVLPGQW